MKIKQVRNCTAFYLKMCMCASVKCITEWKKIEDINKKKKCFNLEQHCGTSDDSFCWITSILFFSHQQISNNCTLPAQALWTFTMSCYSDSHLSGFWLWICIPVGVESFIYVNMFHFRTFSIYWYYLWIMLQQMKQCWEPEEPINFNLELSALALRCTLLGGKNV